MSYDDADAIPSLPCTILLIIITPSSSFVKRRTKWDRIRDEQALVELIQDDDNKNKKRE